jgi:hypothetical protein
MNDKLHVISPILKFRTTLDSNKNKYGENELVENLPEHGWPMNICLAASQTVRAAGRPASEAKKPPGQAAY